MPKKTKKQKILAQQRRHLQLTPSSISPSADVEQTNVSSVTFQYQPSQVLEKTIENPKDREDLTVIRKDLTKTLILAAIAIAVELVVHEVLHGT